jgi:Tol biopolymer transport system component
VEIDVASGKTTAVIDKGAGFANDWLPDGGFLLCTDTVTPLLTTAFAQTRYQLSPDGKHAAYSSTEAGTQEIYVTSYLTFAKKRRVSTSAADDAVWAKGGKELVFRADDGTVMVAEFRGGTIETTTPKPLLKFGIGSTGNRFCVTADGERFLVGEFLQQTDLERPEFHVVPNWQAELERR